MAFGGSATAWSVLLGGGGISYAYIFLLMLRLPDKEFCV